ncbi:retinaldehyde-binding protein 1-like [Anopheles cruzii]|uniref:retinaldehyde-binding protein 1-like n=1 Tax=Anopheles cruzii TaxID=68878 RepID=UPI0022EC9756|nr:retinaldehyde-binding protein 1-like [Anopheles cruzii]
MSKLAVYTVDKSTTEWDEYKFSLPELYRDLAKEELREDDTTRKQGLAEMRQWIVNNPYIRKVRTDAKFLLRFLRLAKFSVPMACEALERYLMMREMYPGWFKNIDSRFALMKQMHDQGIASILGQDSLGRTVVFFRMAPFDATFCKPPQGGQFVALLIESLLELEEVQIGGIQVMIDYSDFDMRIVELWSSADLHTSFASFTGAYPLRYNDTHAARLPKKALPFTEKLLSFVSPKVRERINCYATVAELEKHFDPALQPTGYGGNVHLDAINRKWWAFIEQHWDVVAGADQMEIDLDHYAPIWDEQNATVPTQV